MRFPLALLARRALPILALATPVLACSPDVDDTVERTDPLYNSEDNGLSVQNGLSTQNGLSVQNGLAVNNGLSVQNGLSTQNGLAVNNGLMTSAEGRVMVKYLVKCALPPTMSLVKADQYGTSYTFLGGLGLASGWYTGACDSGCQERITSCLLAMANRDGKHVALELVSAAKTMSIIGSSGDDATYPNQEGAVFGNLFVSPPQMYTCTGTQSTRAEQVKRFCVDGAGCDLFTKVGSCAAACTQTCVKGSGGGQVCSASSCRSPNGTSWLSPITMFLHNKMEAGNFDAQGGTTFGNGVTTYPLAAGAGNGLNGIDDGDWVQMNDVQFGAAGSTTTFTAWVAAVNAGNVIEAHLDSLTGPMIASVTIAPTGGLTTFTAQSAPASTAGVSGAHTVFMYFNGSANRASGANGGGAAFGRISYFELK